MEIAKNIGHNLQLIVNQWFGSQKKFADYFRVSRQTASNWCNGDVLTPLQILLFLEEKTGIPIRTLSRVVLTPQQIDFDNPFNIVKNFETDPPAIIYLNEPMMNKTFDYEPLTLKSDELTELKEKVNMLWTTNLHRAEKMEMWELEQKAMRDHIAKLEAKIKQLEGKG